MTDAELEASVRVRSEGALEVAEKASAEIVPITAGMNSDRWRETLPSLSAVAARLPEFRRARDHLDQMREKEGWAKDSAPARSLAALEHALYGLDGAVALQLKGLGIDHGAPLLEDAIAQLRARVHVVPSGAQETPNEVVGWRVLAFAAAVPSVMLGVTLWTSDSRLIDPAILLFTFGALGLEALFVRQLWRVPCARCGKNFLGSGLAAAKGIFTRGTCAHCGHRPR